VSTKPGEIQTADIVACKLTFRTGCVNPVVERRLISARAGVFAPLTAGMGLAGFTRS